MKRTAVSDQESRLLIPLEGLTTEVQHALGIALQGTLENTRDFRCPCVRQLTAGKLRWALSALQHVADENLPPLDEHWWPHDRDGVVMMLCQLIGKLAGSVTGELRPEAATSYALQTLHILFHNKDQDLDELESFALFFYGDECQRTLQKLFAADEASLQERLAATLEAEATFFRRFKKPSFIFIPSTAAQLAFMTDKPHPALPTCTEEEEKEACRLLPERNAQDGRTVRTDEEFLAIVEEAKRSVADLKAKETRLAEILRPVLSEHGLPADAQLEVVIPRGPALDFSGSMQWTAVCTAAEGLEGTVVLMNFLPVPAAMVRQGPVAAMFEMLRSTLQKQTDGKK